jgi:hypothetical protein
MTHVVAKAVALSLATGRQQWIVGERWQIRPAAKRGLRVVAVVCGREVIRVHAGPRCER